MNSLVLLKFLAGTALLAAILALPGCSTPKANHVPVGSDFADNLAYSVPGRLYLLGTPHPQLYVEVDAVEGCVPGGTVLDKLHHFLKTYCHKPGGIEITRGDVIPLAVARGISPSALARKYLNGPPENPAAPPPAFIYVLFYKDALCDQIPAPEGGPPAVDMKSHARVRNRNPHVDIQPYPAMIYMSTHHVGSPHYLVYKWEEKWNLLHEAGHVLGLAFRRTGASGGHCLNKACLMSAAGRYRYLGMQRRLCQQCAAQLALASSQSLSTNLRFVGPVMVRSEVGYHVLSLPHRVKLILGDLTDNDCQEFAAAVHAEALIPGSEENDWRAEGYLKADVIRDPERLRDISHRAKADPDELARKLATRWWAQSWAPWHSARGEFTQAVYVCREAVLINPEDDWSYNQLAWIKATCPEPSIRDGQEAVSAATKACELTAWKEWNWIDTLAAAYAETGDFHRAIEFQEQALRTGNPGESDQKAMQERILLYKTSQPFRNKL